jgi:phosphoglycerate dehydrogenase-like enzyme
MMSAPNKPPRVAVIFDSPLQADVFTREALDRLERGFEVVRYEGRERPSADDVRDVVRGAGAIVTSWGSPPVDSSLLDLAPNLRLLVHAAGTVKGIVTDALWERGVTVSSCAPAIARGVAEFAFAAIVMGTKRAWEQRDAAREGGWRREDIRSKARELAGAVIGLVGAGAVGRRLLEILAMFDAERLLYDPTVSADEARALGAEKVELDDLCRRADVLSLHAPSIPATRHMIDGRRLALLRDGALVVNTARGSVIDEMALVAELETGRLVAAIDVTDPEPPAETSPLRRLPNVFLTPHLAGAAKGNRRRQGDMAVAEIERFFREGSVANPVTRDMLDRLA